MFTYPACRQIRVREEELWCVRQKLLKGSVCVAGGQVLVDPEAVFCGGYSYGAATAALALSTRPKGSYKAGRAYPAVTFHALPSDSYACIVQCPFMPCF